VAKYRDYSKCYQISVNVASDGSTGAVTRSSVPAVRPIPIIYSAGQCQHNKLILLLHTDW